MSYACIATEEDWKSTVIILASIMKEFDLMLNDKVKQFISWKSDIKLNGNAEETEPSALPNHYIFKEKKSECCVELEFGSIHSVKGRTHLATLVLETYTKTHNIKAILKYLCNKPPKSIGANHSRLKCQYVAMTRAKALLCLALEDVGVKGQEHISIEVAILAAFLFYRYKFLSRAKDKNLYRLPEWTRT